MWSSYTLIDWLGSFRTMGECFEYGNRMPATTFDCFSDYDDNDGAYYYYIEMYLYGVLVATYKNGTYAAVKNVCFPSGRSQQPMTRINKDGATTKTPDEFLTSDAMFACRDFAKKLHNTPDPMVAVSLMLDDAIEYMKRSARVSLTSRIAGFDRGDPRKYMK